jgi:hypothetical protein
MFLYIPVRCGGYTSVFSMYVEMFKDISFLPSLHTLIHDTYLPHTGCGCTAVVAVVVGGKMGQDGKRSKASLIVANAGDSRKVDHIPPCNCLGCMYAISDTLEHSL